MPTMGKGTAPTAALLGLAFLTNPGSATIPLVLISAIGFFVLGPYTFLTGVLSVDLGGKRGSATASPWQWALDSTKLTNGSHSLVVKAFDAAGNVGTSGAVGFTVSNTTTVFMSEKESNGTVASANGVSAGITKITGTMGSTTDKDFFAVPLKAGQTLTVSMTGPNDYDLYLVNASGTQLAASENSTR